MNSISSKEHHLLETDFFCNNVMSLMSLLINLMHPSCIHFFKTKSSFIHPRVIPHIFDFHSSVFNNLVIFFIFNYNA